MRVEGVPESYRDDDEDQQPPRVAARRQEGRARRLLRWSHDKGFRIGHGPVAHRNSELCRDVSFQSLRDLAAVLPVCRVDMKAPPVRADQAPTSVVPDTCKRAVTKVDCHGLTRSERSRDPLIPQNQAIELCPHVVAWQTQSVLAAADLMGRPVRQWCEARVKHRDAVRDNEKSGLRALLKHPADAFSVHRLDFGKTPE